MLRLHRCSLYDLGNVLLLFSRFVTCPVERDPKKRRVKPVETQSSILDFDLGESSDDSDFRIEDHPEISDDDSIDSTGEGGGTHCHVDCSRRNYLLFPPSCLSM